MQFIIGLVVGAALMALAFWLQRKQIVIKWYEWVLAGWGFVMAVWTVNDFFGSMAERNETAGWMLLWMLGVPAVILLGLATFLVRRRSSKTNKSRAAI